ncbi:uncharacterized protein LOC121366798 [Gigantopelta aegis]|uniref:uncharacterized protein LOC121366798 n=1 Tax=Gigantopelta aegis TaxID=1735272 RepID=UPI001B889478|nr:uncharacterized protein LOC121366798 [Gigantopelta aegis]
MSMCFGPCLCIVEFLPYICLVTLPLYGAFCGVDVILRLSLLLYIHSLVVNYIPKVLYSVIPYLELCLLAGLLLLPINLTPVPLIWLYDKLIWLAEPVLLLAEVVLAQNFVMRCSQRVADNIDDDDENAPKWKALVIVFSLICYFICIWLVVNFCLESTSIQLWLVFLVLVVLITMHNMMWMAPQTGIVSDAAFCSLCSIVVLYAMIEETRHVRQPLNVPTAWNKSYSKSFVDVFYSIAYMSAESATKAVLFMKKFLSPFFLVTVGIRLYSILFIVDRVTKNFFQDQDDIDIMTEEEEIELSYLLPWKSPLMLKVAVIFMFTQLTTVFLSECSGLFLTKVSWLPFTGAIWPREIILGRILQIVAANSFYMWRLYRADDWTWSEWLTSDDR